MNTNRQNAQHSTGPRTEEGKNRTRLNGLRHGLTGQTIVMPYEDREAYDRFCADAIASYEPATDAELALAKTIADGSWRLSRARAIEDNIFALDFQTANPQDDTEAAFAQAQTWLDHNREINLLALYAGRISRSIDKTKRELLELQAQRQHAREAALEEAILLTELATSEGDCRTYPGDAVPGDHAPGHGFGFSTEEIARVIYRRKRLAEAIALSKTLKKAA